MIRMVYLTIFSLILLIFGMCISKIMFKTFKSPLGLFAILWNGLLFLASINLIEYDKISSESILLLLISNLIFQLGAIFLGMTFQISRKFKFNIDEQKKINKEKSIIKWIDTSIVLSIIGGILWLFQAVNAVGFVSIVNYNAYTLRGEVLPNINRLVSYMVYVFSMGGSVLMGLAFSKYHIFKKRFILVFSGPLVVSIFIGQRNFIIIMVISLLVPILMNNGRKLIAFKKEYRKLTFKIIIGIVLFFFIIGNLRFGGTNTATNSNILLYLIEHTYKYLTGSFVAFSKVYDSWSGDLYYGINTFTPIFKLTNSLNLTSFDAILIRKIESGRDPVMIPYLFNVFTYVWDIVIDFGYLGIFIFNWFLGFFSSLLWINYERSRDITLRNVIFVFIMTYLFYSFIASITNYSMVIYGYIYASLAVFFSKKHEDVKINKM